MPTPEELRSRAASIFLQLRGGHQPPEDEQHGGDEDDVDQDDDEDVVDQGRGDAGDVGLAGGEPPEGPRPEDAGTSGDELEPVAAIGDAGDAEVTGAEATVAHADPALAPAVANIHETLAEATEYHESTTPLDDAEAPLASATAEGGEATVAAAPAATGASATAEAPAAPPEPEVPAYRPRRELPRVLAIANQKGGVGKTTTAVNLGAALAELGYRVLVIDLDPQGNATTGLGVNARNLDVSIYDVILHDVPIEDTIEPTSLRNLFVVPATIDLAGAEVELVSTFSRELRLRRAVEGLEGEFDFTLIDCPPSLGLLTVNGLATATEVVVPIQCEYYALEGLGQLLRNVNLVKTNLNPALDVTTIILTMYDARTRLAEQVVNEVRSHFGDKVCRNVVPRTVRLSEAPSFGQPIIVFDSSSRGAIAYRELAKEVSGGAPQRIG